jgi:hypothetical protein
VVVRKKTLGGEEHARKVVTETANQKRLGMKYCLSDNSDSWEKNIKNWEINVH